jgi:hypothetical protein
MSICIPGSKSLISVNVPELTFLAGRRARWQRHFAPNELRMNLRVGDVGDLCCRRHGRASCEHQNGVLAWRQFGHLLGNASVHMKAPSVTVKVIHHQINRIPPYPRYLPCGPCAGAFERMVEDWFWKDWAVRAWAWGLVVWESGARSMSILQDMELNIELKSNTYISVL